jgi:putative oxidoreductase
MTLEKSLEKNESSQPKWLSIFRIILGLILFWKGISFIYDSSNLQQMVRNTGVGMLDKNAEAVAFIITYVNLLGGLLIIAGLFTRWASIFQIPILIGAIFFGLARNGMDVDSYELVLSGIVLVLLVTFVIKGSGVISADEYFRNYYKAGYESGHTKKLLD